MVSDDCSARGGAQDTGPPAEATPPQETSPAPTVPLPDPAADLSDDNIEEVRIGAPPDPSSGTVRDYDAQPTGDNYEEDEEEDVDEEEELANGGEETVGATQHWTDEEAEAALTEVRKRITWQGYVPLKQQVWPGAQCRGQSRP